MRFTMHGAVGALANLAKIMQNTAAFWNNMQSQCDAQAKGKLQKLLDTAQKYEDPKKRQNVYESKAVKEHAVKMYVFWSAMESVCTDYTQRITGSRHAGALSLPFGKPDLPGIEGSYQTSLSRVPRGDCKSRPKNDTRAQANQKRQRREQVSMNLIVMHWTSDVYN